MFAIEPRLASRPSNCMKNTDTAGCVVSQTVCLHQPDVLRPGPACLACTCGRDDGPAAAVVPPSDRRGGGGGELILSPLRHLAFSSLYSVLISFRSIPTRSDSLDRPDQTSSELPTQPAAAGMPVLQICID